MNHIASLFASLALLFPFFGSGPTIPPAETFKADTAAMVVYASLADAKVNANEGAKVRCLIFSFQGCPPCATLKAKIEKELVPTGWKIGTKATDDFEIVDVRDRKETRADKYRKGRGWSCPTLVLIDDTGKELARHVGDTRTAQQLADWVKSHRK